MFGCCKVPTESLLIDRIYYRHTHRDILFSFTTLDCVILKPNAPLTCTCFTSLFTTCRHVRFIKHCFGNTLQDSLQESSNNSNNCLSDQGQSQTPTSKRHVLAQFLIEKLLPIANQEHHVSQGCLKHSQEQAPECFYCLESIVKPHARTACQQCTFVVHDTCWMRWQLETCTISDMMSPCPICSMEIINKKRYESFYDISSGSVNIVVYKRRSGCV